MSGVTITLSGAQSSTVKTNLNGYYIFQGLTKGANYTVTPSLDGQVFVPSSRSFNGVSGENTANFTEQGP